MVCCWECGKQFKSREKNGEIEVYDKESGVWTDECPNCGCMGFEEDNYPDEDDY